MARSSRAGAMADHSRLGRGLAALIGDVSEETSVTDSGRKPRRAPIENLRPNPRNPRRMFTDAELDELSDSIRERGIIQPIVVRPLQADNFEIIAGERRWRAAQRAGLHDVPIAVVEANDAQSLEFAIIENVQRTDLNPIEEASGYLALMDDFNRTQEEVAQIVGKSRPHVANTIRLLKLPEPVKQLVRTNKISAGHARLLLGQPNAEQIAHEIIDKDLSVRQVEARMHKDATGPARQVERETKGFISGAKDADTRALEKRLSDALGLAVTIDHRGEGGTLRIKYRDLEQLDAVLKRLGG